MVEIRGRDAIIYLEKPCMGFEGAGTIFLGGSGNQGPHHRGHVHKGWSTTVMHALLFTLLDVLVSAL